MRHEPDDGSSREGERERDENEDEAAIEESER